MDIRICTAGGSAAVFYAAEVLARAGCTILPCPDRTATHLLLPVPSFEADGRIKGGGNLETVLAALPERIPVIGGNLNHPALAGHPVIDLLQDAAYVAENASITAHCAVALAMEKLPVILAHQQVLVIGWGRIGKCLARLLRCLGAEVTVAARKENDRAMLRALGYEAVDTAGLSTKAYRAVFNTAPEMVVPVCEGDGLFMELASRPGLGGANVLSARGLPGQMAPESSGELIAHRILTISNKECLK